MDKPSFLRRAWDHPLYLSPPHRPALFSDPLPTLALALCTYLTLLTLSYLALSPSPYTRLNRLLRLFLLPPALALLSKLFLAHRAGDLEPFNESGFGALGVIIAARAVILSLGLFGRAGRLRWIGWESYLHRPDGYWATQEGKAELKKWDSAVLSSALPTPDPPSSPTYSRPKRLALAALFLLSPRHIGFSTARPPSAYRHPPFERGKAMRYHLSLVLLAGAACDGVILLYRSHRGFCAFEGDASRRVGLGAPFPAEANPLLARLPLLLRVALHTLAVGTVIKSSLHLFQSSLALSFLLLLPCSTTDKVPFPSLTLLNPLSLLLPPALVQRTGMAPAPESVRAFWSHGWHDLLSVDVAHVAFFPLLLCCRIPPFLRRPAAVLAAFTFSGVLHAVSLHAVALGPAYGGMLAVFLLQGGAVAVEHLFERRTGRRVGGAWGRGWTLAVVGASGMGLAALYIPRGFFGFRRPFSPLGWGLKALDELQGRTGGARWWPEREAAVFPFGQE
ncbi:hypothetical protein JCM8097_003855 [Rhodosporidiobolus ruineniae]